MNSNSSYPQPMMMERAAKFSMAGDGIAAQDVSAGESKITVNAEGSIQFK